MKNLKKKQPFNFEAVGDKSQAHEKIVAQIKSEVFKKNIKPGEKLPSERELAEMFSTSRVTVRAAILTLKNRGLVRVKKGMGGGTFISNEIGDVEVTSILRDIIQWKNISIRHVIEVRSMIEPEVAFAAATNATKEDINAIWDTIKELEQFFKVKSKFQSSDENFHRALAAAAKNPLLSLFQSSLIDLLFKFIYDVTWRKEDKDIMLGDHRLIAEKVADKDPEGARAAMVEHIIGMERLLRKLAVKGVDKW
jgi:GntR family transcriptional regulator, transcriptional repressor for pyruvate dehydrogenase complex